ncbi:MAG: TetR family transcriptional regulator [Myxococcota bacterium]|nr:TetR family transcriptional regulator [Myxococcota bacterium]
MGTAGAIEVAEQELPAGLRVKNREQRRVALVEAAYALFAERGYASTTMEDISARAGLSRRTAFRYFASKEELVFPERDQRLALMRGLLEPKAGERAFDTVRRASLALGREYQADRARSLAQWAVVQSEPALIGREMQLDREFELVIEEAFLREEREGPRGRRRARVRASAIVGAVRATLREWFETGATADLVRLGRETFAELERGVGA